MLVSEHEALRAVGGITSFPGIVAIDSNAATDPKTIAFKRSTLAHGSAPFLIFI